MTRIATINLNGIRAAARRGLAQWLAHSRADVLLMQEVRADALTARALLGPAWSVVVAPAAARGRAGVAVAVRATLGIDLAAQGVRVRVGLGAQDQPVDTGRWLEADVDLGRTRLTLVSAYLHSGQVGTPREDQKLAYLPRAERRLTQLLALSEDGGRQAIVAGDFNIVRGERDIKNWKGNHNKTAGVLDVEMAYLNQWVAQGWRDVARELHPDGQGPYTWWSWRGKAFDNDAGWRIDYQFATPGAAAAARDASVDRASSWETRFSDHAPLVVDYDF